MKKWFLLSAILVAVGGCTTTQVGTGEQDVVHNVVRVMFYNVENLFDLEDDTLSRHEEYLPGGMRGWSEYRYREKLTNISKVVLNLGGWDLPVVIGLCEIENRRVLEDLVNNTPLSRFDYEVIHYESPDERGIDVGLLYREGYFEPLHSEAIPTVFSFDPNDKTRDILYVMGLVGEDTLHVFVNHWPSRYGGAEQTQPKRIQAAEDVRQRVDQILAQNPGAKIVVMGDFNDGPDNTSITEALSAEGQLEDLEPRELFNPMWALKRQNKGSHKYQQEWEALDQIMVSQGLLQARRKLTLDPANVVIFDADFLLEEDANFPGKKPYRTYAGMRYLGGYSDHLPVFADLIYVVE